MAKVAIDGVNIYYEVHGEGFPMILAHGLGGNAGEWRFQTSVFCEHYQVILWDMRGQGQSDCPTDPNLYGQDICANDLLGILDHLQVSQAYVGGTSLGGGVATNFALAHPERVAALLIFDSSSSGGIPIPEKARAMRLKTVEIAESQGMSALADYILEANPNLAVRGGQGQNDDEAKALRDRFLRGDAKGYANTVRGMLAAVPFPPEKLAGITAPTLVMGGGDDPSPSLVLTHERIPNSKMISIPAAGHLSNMDNPEFFNREVLAFLSSVDSLRESGEGTHAGPVSGSSVR